MRRRGYGWLPDAPDLRGRDYGLGAADVKTAIPASESLRHPAVTPRDQGATSSCVGFAWAQALELAWAHQGILTGDLSPLWVYWGARALDGTLGFDQGTQLRSAAKAIARCGVATERTHPFSRWRINRSPSWRACRDAFDRRGLRGYYRVSSPQEARRAIASGLPVVGGWSVDEAFARSDGHTPVEPVYRDAIGAHAMVLTGYRADGTFELLNSGGRRWGNEGYGRGSERWVDAGRDLWAVDVREAA